LDAVRQAGSLLESGQTALMAEYVKATPVLNNDGHSSNFECALLQRIASGQRHVLRGHNEIVHGLAFSRDGRLCVSGSFDDGLLFWDVQSGQRIQIRDIESGPPVGVSGASFDSLAFSADGSALLLCGGIFGIEQWHLATGKFRRDLLDPIREVHRFVVSKDGSLLAACIVSNAGGPCASLYKYPTGEKIDDVFAPWDRNYDLDFCHNDQMLAIGHSDPVAKKSGAFLYDLSAKKVTSRLESHSGPVFAVKASPDGSLLALSSEDKTISIWDLATKTRKFT